MHSCPTIGTLPKTTATSSSPAHGTGLTIRMRATSATGSWSVRTPSCRTPCADPAAPMRRVDRNTWTVTVSNCNLAVAPPPDGCRRNGGKILKTSPGRSPRKTRKRSRIEFLFLFLCFSVFLYAARSSASVSRSFCSLASSRSCSISRRKYALHSSSVMVLPP